MIAVASSYFVSDRVWPIHEKNNSATTDGSGYYNQNGTPNLVLGVRNKITWGMSPWKWRRRRGRRRGATSSYEIRWGFVGIPCAVFGLLTTLGDDCGGLGDGLTRLGDVGWDLANDTGEDRTGLVGELEFRMPDGENIVE